MGDCRVRVHVQFCVRRMLFRFRRHSAIATGGPQYSDEWTDYSVFMQEKYGSTKAQTALAGSLCTGVVYIVGPIASGFVNRYGCRAVSSLGTVCSAISIFASAFAPSLPVFIFLYSVCGGMHLIERQHEPDCHRHFNWLCSSAIVHSCEHVF